MRRAERRMKVDIDESVIGKTSEIQQFIVEEAAILAFARAIGDQHPLYTDRDIARAYGYPAIVAPPTFPTTFRFAYPPVPYEPSRSIHGEQEYRYERPIVAGDVLICLSRVVGVKVRHGKLGKMTLLTTEIRGADPEGRLVFTGVSTVILR
ncbi:FAS1-like dehydratase domain-containing protein [Paenibacillus koleovorans]|uniref:FAS1-like dehydratase domain-containing protein n=1 Tax=Paenibacillus koleovorans TaxID=121608 RepID=UPI001FE6F612|nr:MaoC family dehydratase N-terminal domain-containing protein [Paenibacillus koleovorans]